MLMKSFNNRLSLQEKLTFYPLFWLMMGLLITFVFTVTMIKLYLDNYLMSQTTSYSRQIARDVVSIINQDREMVSSLLLSNTIRDLKYPDRISVLLERLLSKNQNFLEGYIIDLEGQTVSAVSRLKVFSSDNIPLFAGQPLYEEAKQGVTTVSGWDNFTEDYQPYWYMAVPIEKYPGKIAGVLIVTIDMRRIEDVILTSQGAKYGDPILLDRKGKILVHLDRSKLGYNWNQPNITHRVLKGEIGTARYDDENGQFVLAAYQPLSPYKWGLIVQVPPNQTVYELRNKVILLFGLMTVIMFVITGLFMYLAAKKITKPILDLTQATQEYGQNHQLSYQPLPGTDEIAQLSSAFTEMAASLSDMEIQRAQYISMIAHDIRNPLTSIRDIFPILESNDFNEVEKKRSFNSIESKLNQVNRMIGDLLDFSRLDLGQICFSSEKTSIRYLCEDTIAGYGRKRSKFVLKPFSEELCAWVDPLRLQQILQNLFDNSLKYSSEGEPVTIDCVEEDHHVIILVTDRGNGIPPETMAKLFTPFQNTKNKRKGSYGLGLAIAKRLALGMNGDLTVESQKGEGTTFRIILPKSFEPPH